MVSTDFTCMFDVCMHILISLHLFAGCTLSHGPVVAHVVVNHTISGELISLMKDYISMVSTLRKAELLDDMLMNVKIFLDNYCRDRSILDCSSFSAVVDLLIDKLYIYVFNIDTLTACSKYFEANELTLFVQQYDQRLRTFLSSTSVTDFKDSLQSQVKRRGNLERITMKLDKAKSNATLTTLKELTLHCFGDSSKLLSLVKICTGCVCVTWLAPTLLVPTLRMEVERLSHEDLADRGVREIVIGLRVAPSEGLYAVIAIIIVLIILQYIRFGCNVFY